MFNNVALDVFIGLVFIFLLYSLLATIMMEFIAHAMHLRPRLLIKALRRMLEDNPPEIFGIKRRITFIDFFSDVKESVKRYFVPFKNLYFLKRFYYHPTIKYLGESRSSSKPSYMHANNFSQTILQLFRGNPSSVAISQIAAVEHYLFKEAEQILVDYEKYKHWVVYDQLLKEYTTKKDCSIDGLIAKIEKNKKAIITYEPRKLLLQQLITDIRSLGSIEEVGNFRQKLAPLLIQVRDRKISSDTLKHFQNLFIDAQNDLEKFTYRLEVWFEETMERTTGWYKRQTQIMLLCLGLGMAVWANVDTIKIYRTLAKDKKVRDQLVTMAIQSQDKYSPAIKTIRADSVVKSPKGDTTTVYQTKVLTTGDSILDRTYKLLEEDISSAGNILGLGWCNSDSCKQYQKKEATLDSLKRALAILEEDTAKDSTELAGIENRILLLSKDIKKGFRKFRESWDGWSVVGWLITALAISLGAPFWFDLLNKLVKVRSAGTKVASEDRGDGNLVPASARNTQPLIVNFSSNANNGEEAVG